MQISKDLTIDFNITPKEIGRLVAEMDNIEQADFLNELAECLNEWSIGKALMQFQYLTDTKSLSIEARQMIANLSDYLKTPESIK